MTTHYLWFILKVTSFRAFQKPSLMPQAGLGVPPVHSHTWASFPLSYHIPPLVSLLSPPLGGKFLRARGCILFIFISLLRSTNTQQEASQKRQTNFFQNSWLCLLTCDEVHLDARQLLTSRFLQRVSGACSREGFSLTYKQWGHCRKKCLLWCGNNRIVNWNKWPAGSGTL